MLLYQALSLSLNPNRPDVISVVGGGGKSSTVFRLGAEVASLGKRAVVTHTARIAAFQTDWAPAVVEVTSEGAIPWDALAHVLDASQYCLVTGPIAGDRRLGLSPEAVDALAARSAQLGIAAISIEADGSKRRPVKAPAPHEPVLPESTTMLVPSLGLDAVGAPFDERHTHRPALLRSLLGLPADTPMRLAPAQAAQVLVHPDGGARGLVPTASFVPLLNKADDCVRLTVGRLVANYLAKKGQQALLAVVGHREREPVVERWGPVAAVVLAAGASTRMGRPKQVEVVDGRPMIVRAVQTALAGGVHEVVVVTGAFADRVCAALVTFAPEMVDRLRIVHNPEWAEGQAASVRAALDALGTEVRAALFLPVDQPFLRASLLAALVRRWQQGAPLAAPVVEGLLRGAPALFDRSLFGELRAVTGDAGGRSVLRAHAAEVAEVPAPALWLVDVDRAEDLP